MVYLTLPNDIYTFAGIVLIEEKNHIQVFVKSLTGATHTFEIPKNGYVCKLKQMYGKICGESPDYIRFIYKSRELLDWDIISESEITIHAVLRLRGGMYHESSGRE